VRILFGVFFILYGSFSTAKTPHPLSCVLQWKTLSEGPIEKKISVLQNGQANLTKHIQTIITSDEKTSSVEVKESDKSNSKNYVTYFFQCNTTLSCHGSRKQSFNSKSEIQKFKIEPTSTAGSGKIGERQVFTYLPLKDGFEYQYIAYTDNDNQPMGLKVQCHE
jgi:hypothetical protein